MEIVASDYHNAIHNGAVLVLLDTRAFFYEIKSDASRGSL
jgi:hypothetical protein